MRKNIFYGRTPLFMGVVFGACYWIFEGLVHYFIFSGESLLQEMLPFSHPHELWMRLFTSLLFVLFGVLIRYITREQLISQKEIDHLQKMLQICSLCGKVCDDDKWLAAREFGKKGGESGKKILCPECRSIHPD